ncbi:MAG: DNA-3-methyladenine glycosylase family protein [Candidatus Limnocylindrales bacterium]
MLVRLEGPVDLAASLEPFRRWGDDRLDRFDGRVVVRTVPLPTGAVAFSARIAGTIEQPALGVDIADAATGPAVAAAVATMIVGGSLGDLTERDPVLGALDRRFPGVRPVLQFDLLASLVRAISAQQVNLRWAATIRSRVAAAYGHLHRVGAWEVWSLDAEALAQATVDELRVLQLTTAKSRSLAGCAGAVASGQLSMAELRLLDDEAVIERLVELPGIGRWSAEWFLARTLGRPRVVAGDLGVRKAIGAAYLAGRMPSEAEVRQLTAHWGDAAGIAQQLLLQGLATGSLEEVLADAQRTSRTV